MEQEIEVKNTELTDEEKAKKKKKIRNRILTIIFVLINVAIIAFTAINEFSGDHSSDPKPVIETKYFILYMFCAIMCLVIALILEIYKYASMAKTLGEPIKVSDAIRVVVLGRYYDCITPSGTGGQPFQIYNLHKAGYSDGTSAALPLGGFFTMQCGFILLGLIVFFTNFNIAIPTAIRITAYVGLVCYSLMPTLIVIFAISNKAAINFVMFFVKILAKLRIIKDLEETSQKIIKYLTEYNDSIKRMTKHRFTLTKLLILSILYQIGICSIPYFVLLAFGANVTFYEMLSITVFIYAAITIIPTPGNSGAAEGSFYLIFSKIGDGSAFWPMIAWRGICYYLIVFIGIIANIHSVIKNKKISKQNEKELELEENKE